MLCAAVSVARPAAARGHRPRRGAGGTRRHRRRHGHRGRPFTSRPSWTPASGPSRPSRSWCPKRAGWRCRRSGTWGMDRAQAELACLLVSEVVTNAVLHTAAAASPRRESARFRPGAVPAADRVAGAGGRVVPGRSWDPAARHGLAAAAAQGLRHAAAARVVGGLGRGVRRGHAAAADPVGRGERRGRPRPVPGGAARHPVGLPADTDGKAVWFESAHGRPVA